jgi:hypothetical protein
MEITFALEVTSARMVCLIYVQWASIAVKSNYNSLYLVLTDNIIFKLAKLSVHYVPLVHSAWELELLIQPSVDLVILANLKEVHIQHSCVQLDHIALQCQYQTILSLHSRWLSNLYFAMQPLIASKEHIHQL